MLEFKKVKKENYISFSNMIFFSVYSTPKELLSASLNGMLIVWDGNFGDKYYKRIYGRSVQESLGARSDIMSNIIR